MRQKALLQPITKEELAWILLNFNQKRGYYQLRGKDGISKERLLRSAARVILTSLLLHGKI